MCNKYNNNIYRITLQSITCFVACDALCRFRWSLRAYDLPQSGKGQTKGRESECDRRCRFNLLIFKNSRPQTSQLSITVGEFTKHVSLSLLCSCSKLYEARSIF